MERYTAAQQIVRNKVNVVTCDGLSCNGKQLDGFGEVFRHHRRLESLASFGRDGYVREFVE